MNVSQKKNYVLVTPSTSTFEVFRDKFKDQKHRWTDKHVVLDLKNIEGLTRQDLASFLPSVIEHKETKSSFIVLANGIHLEELEEQGMNVAPTLTEAEDLMEMEAIERDLGF
jgi:hypothetical protein